MWVVRLRFGCREQDQGRVRTGGLVRSCDELFADPLSLKLSIDGKVREVRAVVEIGDRPCDSDEQACGISCGKHHIGMAQHSLDPLGVCDGTAF